MNSCRMKYFVLDDELQNSCDFNPKIWAGGKGIYEVFRVINGTPLFLKEHIDRYFHSLELGGFQKKPERSQLVNRLKSLIDSNRLKQGNIQFEQVTSDMQIRFIASVIPAIYPTSNDYKNGVELLSLNAVRELPQLKSLNLPAREKANKLISDKGIFEVLFIDDNGILTEGSRSNIFFVSKDELYTTPLSLILDGITRANILKLAEDQNIKVNREFIPFESISRFDAAFLTSTSMKVLPIRKIDGINFNTSTKLVTRIKTN